MRGPYVLMWLVVGCAALASAQDITITLTDKSGTRPRSNLLLSYNVTGINVDDQRTPPVLLLSSTTTTNGAGALTIPIDGIARKLNENTRRLNGSHRVSIELVPFSDEALDTVTADFLLGSSSQKMTLVMMKTPVVHRRQVETVVAVLYGKCGTFHLAGERGTAHYKWRGRQWLSSLEFTQSGNNYVIYQEADSAGALWAFSSRSGASANCSYHDTGGYAVWVWDQQQRRWRIFGWATKSTPANVDAFAQPELFDLDARTYGVTLPEEFRTWTDITGRYRRVAALAGFDIAQQIVLLLEKGSMRRLSVQWHRLSEADRAYLSRWVRRRS